MRVLGIDFETTGLDVEKDRIIEIGAVLWDTDRKAVLEIFNCIINHPEMEEIPAEAAKVHGITIGDMREFGESIDYGMGKLEEMIRKSHYLLAHNGVKFDYPLMEAEFLRLQSDGPEVIDEEWRIKPRLDSLFDIPYPPEIQGRKLMYLAPEHGFLNPFPHRAFSDVLTMLKVLSFYDFDKIIELSKSPMLELKADVAKPWHDGGISTSQAKEKGYKFDGDTKWWTRKIRECELESHLKECEFEVIILKEK